MTIVWWRYLNAAYGLCEYFQQVALDWQQRAHISYMSLSTRRHSSGRFIKARAALPASNKPPSLQRKGKAFERQKACRRCAIPP